MRIGNVIKSPYGHLWIVTEVHDHRTPPIVEAVAFDAENSTAIARLDDHTREEQCFCGESTDGGSYDEGCEDCHGAGRYIKHIKGWKHAKVIAPHVKAFIMNGVKRQFGID